MPENDLEFEVDDPEDAEAILAKMLKFIAGVEKHREELSFISDEQLDDLRARCDDIREKMEVCRIANAHAAETANAVNKARAAYELELERHITRQAQAQVSKAFQAKKPRFND